MAVATRTELVRLASEREGRQAIGRIVRLAKTRRVGTAIADLTVCGAIPPYNEVLGAKLVAALMATPEVIRQYRQRYGKSPSVIASSMAGQRVVRPADLVFIGTTSLYGQRPSQYDRISVPWNSDDELECAGIRYEYLGRTLGIGTFQFGERTVAELKVLLAQSRQGQQVNSIFGEGVNPRLRKIRDGLNELGLPTDELLRHGAPRLVYGASLVRNLSAYLLGQESRPRYVVPQKDVVAAREHVVRWWIERWVAGWVEREEVLARMEGHTFVHPIRHGARVRLPRVDIEQRLLFDADE